MADNTTKKTNEEKELLVMYFEIENTINERYTQISERWISARQAVDDMKNHSDWYGSAGSGKVFQVKIWLYPSGKVEIDRTEYYRRA